tara:strand:+ start:1013 stop:1252 length:240 start_codon:yes stop_codon:yes gene_type:complete
MNKWMVILIISFVFLGEIQTKSTKSKIVKSKTYKKKPMYDGLGKKSKTNGLIKAKGISGHWKGNPAKGYKFVNAYSRSK